MKLIYSVLFFFLLLSVNAQDDPIRQLKQQARESTNFIEGIDGKAGGLRGQIETSHTHNPSACDFAHSLGEFPKDSASVCTVTLELSQSNRSGATAPSFPRKAVIPA